MGTSRKAAYCSLGCKVNQYDTEAMRKLMEDAGYETVDFDDTADVYVINTCSVTHISDRKSRQMISRAHQKNPSAVVVAAGCYAKTNPSDVSQLSGVNIILGTNDRNSIVDIIENYISSSPDSVYIHTDTDRGFEDLSADESDKTRAILKIQDGCNRFCSYCIIPYARGRIRSRSLQSTGAELKKLASHGYKEVVLTGIHLMSYGMDMADGTSITDAMRLAEDTEGICRIRLGSLEPVLTDDKFIDFAAKSRKLCRQFHLSLQSGSDTVLERMNRRYTAAQYSEVVDKLRQAMPGCAITTDIIAGFVGETDKEHGETLDFIRKIGFSRVHVFPYSVRQGTKAAQMTGHLDKSIKDMRVRELIAVSDECRIQYMSSYVGTCTDVLFEESCDGGMRGYTDTYIDVHVPGDTSLENTIRQVRITGIHDKYLTGELT